MQRLGHSSLQERSLAVICGVVMFCAIECKEEDNLRKRPNLREGNKYTIYHR